MRNSNGFTLFEVLIVVIIMSVMGILTFQSIRETGKSKIKIEKSLDSLAGVRDALQVMSRDINLAFHWRDVNAELKQAIVADAKKNNKPVPPSLSATPDPNLKQIAIEKVTQFIGAEKELHFTSLSFLRMIKDSPESDQAEISYFLKSVKTSDGKSTQALVRRSSPILDEDVTKGGTETVLLGHVVSLKFAYMGGEPGDDWKSDWKSSEGLDDKTKGKFPVAVEISLETDNDGVKTKLSTIAAVHMPNNEPIAPPSTKDNAAPGFPGSTNPNDPKSGGPVR